MREATRKWRQALSDEDGKAHNRSQGRRPTNMQMVKIRFPDDKSCTQGFYELMKRVRVVCLPGDEFVVSESALIVLDELAIPYLMLDRNGFDHALTALRDTAAAPV